MGLFWADELQLRYEQRVPRAGGTVLSYLVISLGWALVATSDILIMWMCGYVVIWRML